ncbi:MAG: histidine phosphatase family protein [Anaerolineae bacterium]|nr:histidine phosphatase family protein [Anaerolineae bacterium]
MSTLLLIRHGENDFVGRRLAGRLPGVHLNAVGRSQAEALAAMLHNEPLTAIYASPLDRTLETAAPLARDLFLTVQENAGLLEVDFGAWQGKTLKYLKRLKLWQTVQNSPSAMRFPGGESFLEAQQRVVSALEEIKKAHAENERVACFSHCDTIRLAIAHYLDMPLDAFQRLNIQPASVTRLQFAGDQIILQQVNQLATTPVEPA